MTRIRNNAVRTTRMTEALRLGGHTYKSLSAISGLNVPAVATWIKSMREMKAVYISGWEKDSRGRLFVPVYRWGPSVLDVPRKLVAKTNAARQAAFRERKRDRELFGVEVLI